MSLDRLHHVLDLNKVAFASTLVSDMREEVFDFIQVESGVASVKSKQKLFLRNYFASSGAYLA